MKFIILKEFKFLRLISMLILGLLIGSSTTILLIGSQVDQLNLEKEGLEHRLSACEDENTKLQESLQKRKLVVTSIEPIVTIENDDLTSYERESYTLEITKIIKELLNPLNGKEIEDIDYTLVPEVLENRIVTVDGKNFRLHVNTIIFSQKVIVVVKARNHHQN